VNADLVAGVLTVTHSLASDIASVVVKDNTDKQVMPDDVTFTSTTALDVDLTSFAPIAGTWKVLVRGE
jgi:hypothetical protein